MLPRGFPVFGAAASIATGTTVIVAGTKMVSAGTIRSSAGTEIISAGTTVTIANTSGCIEDPTMTAANTKIIFTNPTMIPAGGSAARGRVGGRRLTRAVARSIVIGSAMLLGPAAHGQVVYLSDFLGVVPGEATCASNPPFTSVISCGSFQFGCDCPGNWTGIQIRFVDAGPFAKGIGMHPPHAGESWLRFNLDAIRGQVGREPLRFESRIGIEWVTSPHNHGANFIVLRDGAGALAWTVPGRESPSIGISVPTEGIRFLDLSTTHTGVYNSNHACWAEARLVLGPPCPTPVLGDPVASTETCPAFPVNFIVLPRYWGPVTHQWQWRPSPGAAFIDMTDGLNTDPLGGPISFVALNPMSEEVILSDYGATDTRWDIRAIVSNPCGGVISNEATLIVRPATTITTPADQTVCPGGMFEFSVTAAGHGPLHYQWYLNGSPVGSDSNRWSGIGSQVGRAFSTVFCAVTSDCHPTIFSMAAVLNVCIADTDDGSGTGACDGGVTIEDLIYYLGIFDVGLPGADVDDGSAMGTPDGGVTIEDLLYYLARFDAGC